MGEAKPWQIAVVVVGVLTLVGMLMWQCQGDGVTLQKSIVMVDVTSGELVESTWPKGKAVVFPAHDPDTKAMLIPVGKTPEGRYEIEGRYMPLLRAQKVQLKGLENAESGLVRSDAKLTKKDIWK
ncbi:MAG: hypothetical protein U0640_15705 [Phycisphaerales bacterium]